MKISRHYSIAVLLLIFFGRGVCFCQAPPFDSLLTVFHNEELPDTARVNALITLGNRNFGRQFPDSLLHLYQSGESMIRNSGTPGDHKNAAYQQAQAKYYLGNYIESLQDFKESIDFAEEQRDTVLMIKGLHSLGNCYMELSDFSSSVKYSTEALVLSEMIGNQRYVAVINANIGMNYVQFGDFTAARNYLQTSLNLDREEKDIRGQIRGLTNIGWTYGEEGDFAKSQEYHLMAYELVQKEKTFGLESTVLLNVGDTYFNLEGQETQAEYYIKRGYKLAKANNERPALARGSIQLAHLLQQSNPDSALYYAQQGLSVGQDLGNLIIVENALEILSQLYEDKNMEEKALGYHKRWKITLDSIFSEKKQKAIYKTAAKYEYEKKKLRDEITLQKAIAKLELAAQMKFYLLLVLLIIIVLGFLFFYSSLINGRAHERIRLLHEMDLLRERISVGTSKALDEKKAVLLNRERIEKHLAVKLGESSWRILILIFENPSISNREVADQMALSVEGVSSSLRRMYKSFGVKSESSKNLKIALITEAAKLSERQ